ncbi:MAG: hypothetical protein JNM94_12825 [Phycisphaerae bacterium]|nr:hypothetical protein [Phycisphaerae bacterium]
MHDSARSAPASTARSLSDAACVPLAAFIMLTTVGFRTVPTELQSNGLRDGGPWLWVPFVAFAILLPVAVALLISIGLSIANQVQWRATIALLNAGERRAAGIVGVARASHANQLAIVGTIGGTILILLTFAQKPAFTGSTMLFAPVIALGLLLYGVPGSTRLARHLHTAIAGGTDADASSAALAR